MLRPSKALDALRKARLYGTLRNELSVLTGASIVAASSVLPLLQEIILVAGGSILVTAGIVFLVLRQVRGYRTGSEL